MYPPISTTSTSMKDSEKAEDQGREREFSESSTSHEIDEADRISMQMNRSPQPENEDVVCDDDSTLDTAELERIQERKRQSASSVGPLSGIEDGDMPIPPLPQYRMLDSVIDAAVARRKFKQPMLFDILLAVGLLFAVAGFTTGLMRIYIIHMAKQNINQHNYRAAITILKRNSVPEFFSGFGSDPSELLNQALYLDALNKLEANSEDQAALSQLGKITEGSRFYDLAQKILKENTPRSKGGLKPDAGSLAPPHEVVNPAASEDAKAEKQKAENDLVEKMHPEIEHLEKETLFEKSE
ncbi:MAG: hypothetical protein K2X93_05135 [Candidatus Obscuribacterales bacterium]|nr:hypothetical protein [Candidatus Obscuribacterales bacterium]